MPTASKMVRKMIKQSGLEQELKNKPSSKRSVAVARRGNASHRQYGNRTSHCTMTKKGVHKRSS